MPVRVTIEIIPEDTRDYPAKRILEIERVKPKIVVPPRDPESVAIYKVDLSGGHTERREAFTHQYRDDLLTLVAEAIVALGGNGGPYKGLIR